MYLLVSLLIICSITLFNFFYEFLIAVMRLGETHEKINEAIYFILFVASTLWGVMLLSYGIYLLAT